jgi:3-dehydroquinate synthase
MNIILYGPPASGKTGAGRMLAERLGREFVDADALVEARAGLSVTAIFERHGEAAFRRLEAETCAALARTDRRVIALGAGALLDPASRRALEGSGVILLLHASLPDLVAKLPDGPERPLLSGDDPASQLSRLLESRKAHYGSFPERIDTSGRDAAAVVELLLERIARRTLSIHALGLRHDVVLGCGLLEELPVLLSAYGTRGPFVLVTDENVARCLGSRFPVGFPRVVLPAGEAHKTPATSASLCERFAELGLDRTGTVIAVGGGVIGDLAGFSAATFMRGVSWVNVPTTLLAMVDASIGGKTGVNLPTGKNLVGAFHPPAFVVADPLTLATLPPVEWVNGMAEVVKHAVIGGPDLFEQLERPAPFGSLSQLARSIGVKIGIVEKDPFERGERAILNLGHTVGHAIEVASGYTVRHGEAVAMGLVVESRLAERLGIGQPGLADRIGSVLSRIGLRTTCAEARPEAIRAVMAVDKKRAGAKPRFTLPAAIGDVRHGIEVDATLLMEVLAEYSRPE